MPTVGECIAAFERERERRREIAERRPTSDAKRAFYSGLDWRRLRYSALRKNAIAHNGRSTCELCGSIEEPMHCDHIVPVSKDWSRRLDPTNVQILCGPCNTGKLNRDSIDWRASNGTEEHVD